MTVTNPGQIADAMWFLNDLARVQLRGEQVDGRVSIVDFTSPPGDMPPLHRHEREDELFYVVSGRLALHQPGRRVEAEAGGALFAERGIAHAYEVLGDVPARYLVIATPAGFERFVSEIARRADRLGLPEPSDADPEKMAVVASRFGIELLGPPGTLP
jgi:quercetin dioxygenase-like cupin family protein